MFTVGPVREKAARVCFSVKSNHAVPGFGSWTVH